MTPRSILPVLAAALLATPAWAGSIEVGPILVQMVGPERTATLTITNASDEAESLQVRTVEWSQGPDGDAYAPSQSLIASPPLVELKAGESQTIRLVVEGVADNKGERAYRVILDEIPRHPEVAGAGVKTAIRVLVPVFLTPSLSARARLSWSAARTPQGIVVTARNDGESRERLSDLRFEAGGQALGQPLGGYVLSHSSRAWTLIGAPAGADALTAAADGANGAVQAHVPIGQ
jgi:fimbrial chaperone protein